MLCELAHNFPPRIAQLLERDRGLTRNFREETVTDLLMASLVGLEAFGVRVQFPYEPTTGGDMDWIYAAPHDINGGSYLRLILQAKRAQHVKSKNGGYWYYQHLDHQKGIQAQVLVNYAATSPDGMATLPLYIFYHPEAALLPAESKQPAVQGINIVFASKVAPAVKGGCGRKIKRVSHWRNDFMPLSDLLCWPAVADAPPAPSPDATEYLVGQNIAFLPGITGSFHPDLIARRLQTRRTAGLPVADDPVADEPIRPSEGIPDDVVRAIEGRDTNEDRRLLLRPRAIFSTRVTRGSADYETASERTKPSG
jgi:hypothetical protein